MIMIMSIEVTVMNGFAKTGIGRVTFALLYLSPAVVALGVLFGLLDLLVMVTIFPHAAACLQLNRHTHK